MGSDSYWRRLLKQSTRRPARLALGATLAGGLGVLAASGVSADGPCQSKHCTQPASTPNAEQIALGKQKQDLAARYFEKAKTGEPLGSLADDMKAWEKSVGDNTSADITRDTIAGPEARTAAEMSAAASSNKKTLATNWYEQVKWYYCGPATAWVVDFWSSNKFHNSQTNSWRGDPLGQPNLAGSNWLQTTEEPDPNPGTGFGTNWLTTLNCWWSNCGTSGWYLQQWAPVDSFYTSDLKYSIDRNHPLVLDTVAWANSGPRLFGYRNDREYWHYVTGNGYDYTTGYKTTYTDTYNTKQTTKSLGQHTGFDNSLMITLLNTRGYYW
jgi:hypothetical protein